MDIRVVQASCMRTIGSNGKDGKNNMVYQNQQFLKCLLLSSVRVICTRCWKKEIKKDCVARAERFKRQWPFRMAMTVSDGGYFFALLFCTYRWPFHKRSDGVSASVRENLVQRLYWLWKDGVSVSVRNYLVLISYCLWKNEVSVSVRNKLVTSLYCSWKDEEAVFAFPDLSFCYG